MNSIVLSDRSGWINHPKIISHLHQTLKVKEGDSLRFCILNQGLCQGVITKIDQLTCQVDLGPIEHGLKPWFDLIVGVSRPQTTKKILEHATTFGARKIIFFNADKSEKSYLTSKVFEPEERLSSLVDGLAQSARYYTIPEVEVLDYHPARRFINSPELKEQPRFILDLESSESFMTLYEKKELSFDRPAVLAIGPERGWTKSDLLPFREANFQNIKISSSVLRVEHAIYSAISQLELLRKNF